jgi:adenine-specific DNA-methyltransferase
MRSPWYVVPLPKRMPDAFLPYMHHLGPRLIVNTKGARNSNLLHGVALRPGAPSAAALAVAMASSLTLLSAEVEGRAYGGGVLKLETKEAERVLLPSIENPEPLARLLPEVDQLIRSGEVEGAAVLVDGLLGLPHPTLWQAYETLRTRRLGRRQVTHT